MTFGIAPFIADTSYLALVVRLFLGISLILHGYPKVKGGWRQAGKWMSSMGVPASTAVFATIIEFFGGILFVLGLIVPIVAAFAALQFAAIIVVKTSKMKASYIPKEQGKPGSEIDWLYLTLSLVLIVLGAGALSIDSLLF